jgi:hypothetical protein
LCDAFQVPKPLSPQLQPFGKSDDDLGELTFEVGRFLLCPSLADGPRPPGGRSALLVFVPCSSCSCSPFVFIRRDFEFWLDGVSDGPQQRADGLQVPGGQSACSPRRVRGSRCATGGSICFNGRSVAQAGQSAARVRTVRGTLLDGPRGPSRTVRAVWPDSPLEAARFASWFESSLSSFVLPRVLQGIVLRLEVDP